jgi:hypothetical protein
VRLRSFSDAPRRRPPLILSATPSANLPCPAPTRDAAVRGAGGQSPQQPAAARDADVRGPGFFFWGGERSRSAFGGTRGPLASAMSRPPPLSPWWLRRSVRHGAGAAVDPRLRCWRRGCRLQSPNRRVQVRRGRGRGREVRKSTSAMYSGDSEGPDKKRFFFFIVVTLNLSTHVWSIKCR